jgi:phenylalanyl-tRNA synthetase beta chain
MHAFDADKIAGKKVLVKTLPEGSKFVTLDGKERKLSANDLMICNGNSEPMCIGGVFGGIGSGITAETKNVFLESAYFSPAFVRKTGMTLQLKTDASFRYERGTDPNNTVFALKRAALLIKEIAGGLISSEVIDVYPDKIENTTLKVKVSNINRLIGKEIDLEEIYGILERLDIRITAKGEGTFDVSVPPYRVDVKQEADIVEEILRIYGLNNIELSQEAGADFISGFPVKDINRFRQSVGTLLASNGFYEIMTNSLTHSDYRKYDIGVEGEPVDILNKLSEETAILRTTMLFTGLEVCSFNINRKQKDLKLFEFGKVYTRVSGKYVEKERLALYLTGQYEADTWQRAPRNVSYHDLSRFVANVVSKSAGSKLKFEKITDAVYDYGVKIVAGNIEIGRMGKVKTQFQKDFGIKQEIFYADLDVALLFNSANPKFDVQDVPKFPEVRRDLSLVLDRHVAYREIEELVRSTEKKLVKEVIVFDVYEGDKIPPGKKAYALGFTLQDESKTMTDEEIEKTMTRLIGAFETKMQALIRK